MCERVPDPLHIQQFAVVSFFNFRHSRIYSNIMVLICIYLMRLSIFSCVYLLSTYFLWRDASSYLGTGYSNSMVWPGHFKNRPFTPETNTILKPTLLQFFKKIGLCTQGNCPKCKDWEIFTKWRRYGHLHCLAQPGSINRDMLFSLTAFPHVWYLFSLPCLLWCQSM